MTEEKSFKVGDLVTRDGSDVQRVIEADNGYGAITVECIKAPDSGWCKVGDRELNLAGRYSRLPLKDVTDPTMGRPGK